MAVFTDNELKTIKDELINNAEKFSYTDKDSLFK